MITLDEAKTILKLGSDSDTQIMTLLPIIEDLIITETQNDFSISESQSAIVAGDTLTVTSGNLISSGTIYIDAYGVYIVLSGTDTTIVIDGTITDAPDNTITFRKTRYPRGVKLLAATLLKYHMDKRGIGVKSESVDDYSISYADDLPAGIRKELNRYSRYKMIRGN